MELHDPQRAHGQAGVPVTGRTWRDLEVDADDLAGMTFHDCTFERVRLTGTSVWQTLFISSTFTDCEFIDCKLLRTQWVDCSGGGFRVVGGEFREAVLSRCRFGELVIESSGDRVTLAETACGRLAFDRDGCRQHALTVSDCRLDAVAAESASFDSLTGVGLDLANWALANAGLERCMLVEATAEGMDLGDVRFQQCNLVRSNFAGARIRHAPGTIFAECDCTDADFAGAELTGALFAHATAPGARFTGANLTNAMFPGAALAGADLSGARATQSVWNGADLSDANFERTDATQATFRNSVLAGTRVNGTVLREADLHGVEASLTGADRTGARDTIEWRAKSEAGARLPPRG